MVLVTFKNSYDETVCMMTEKFNSVKAAKLAIEDDGYAFAVAHGYKSGKWVEPNSRDYFKVVGNDGHSCIWQYFCM